MVLVESLSGTFPFDFTEDEGVKSRDASENADSASLAESDSNELIRGSDRSTRKHEEDAASAPVHQKKLRGCELATDR